MPVTKGYKQLLEEANARIETVPVADAISLHGGKDVVFVDIRDVREVDRGGQVEGAMHAPRGMLEFWVDPESPYHKPELGRDDVKYVFYCASGWRSALAADQLRSMGMTNVAHVEGGFTAWKEAGGPIAERNAGKAKG